MPNKPVLKSSRKLVRKSMPLFEGQFERAGEIGREMPGQLSASAVIRVAIDQMIRRWKEEKKLSS